MIVDSGGRSIVADMPLALRPCLDHAAIALAGAAIFSGIGVDDLAPVAGLRQRHAIIVARHRREIGDDGHRAAAGRVAQPGEYRILAVVDDQPLKAFRLAVAAHAAPGATDRDS